MTRNDRMIGPAITSGHRRGGGRSPVLRIGGVALVAVALSGCNFFQRLSNVGEKPEMRPVENPTERQEVRPVSFPMPAPQTAQPNPGSLWRQGARFFLKDQRASRVGDILTVTVSIADSANQTNTSARQRTGTETLGVPQVLGFETELSGWLPRAFNAANAVNINSGSTTGATTSVVRADTITMRVAAVVTQVLPNGNMVVHGRQEVRVDYDVRELVVGGVIRGEDINFNNEIAYDKIAEARISYSGRGVNSDLHQPRYGQQVLDIVLPF